MIGVEFCTMLVFIKEILCDCKSASDFLQNPSNSLADGVTTTNEEKIANEEKTTNEEKNTNEEKITRKNHKLRKKNHK